MSDVSSNSYFSSNNQSYKLVLPEKSASKTDQHGDNTTDLKYNQNGRNMAFMINDDSDKENQKNVVNGSNFVSLQQDKVDHGHAKRDLIDSFLESDCNSVGEDFSGQDQNFEFSF